ncbi:MAG: dTDP-4-dehydrorhamnose reductase [Jannaschia sp.]
MSGLLVFGATGQVARELRRAAPDATFLDRSDADLSVPGACRDAILVHTPDAVINAAAYTAVDRAEQEEVRATAINGVAPGEMAATCAERDVPFVQISTDYVFDGSGTTPWKPDDGVGPLGAYGRTKLVGEEAIKDAGGSFVVLRTSWVFSAHGANFVKSMLDLGAQRDRLTVVADQIGGPTPARDIALACLAIVTGLTAGRPSGIHHFAGLPDISWAGFARAIFEEAGMTCAVEDIAGSAWPTAAFRPANSRMDCTSLERTFGITRPDWRAGLRKIIAELETS